MKPESTFQDYWKALDGATPVMKEDILGRAWHEGNFDWDEFKRLVDKAYPDSW